MTKRRVAVVGAGWAGLAAAVESTRLGHQVTVFELSHRPGGRARTLPHDGLPLDNGQHILIGAYRDTLALMRQVGVAPEQVLLRRPLSLVDPQSRGLCLPGGPALPAFVWGVMRWQALPWLDRIRLLKLAARWRLQGFRCDPSWTVAELARDCPPSVYHGLLDPLCVAALNTPAEQASAQVLLTVLRDALFAGPGSADLLLPRRPLSDLLPEPALRWLQSQGATWRPGHQVRSICPTPPGRWSVDDQEFDHVVLACSAAASARLMRPVAPAWAAVADALTYQPIVTVWLRDPLARWPLPMLSLPARPGTPAAPAQFGFDLGALGGPPGHFALVVSGAAAWVAAGLPACADAVLTQWRDWFGREAELLTVRAEKRATFACQPGLQRPTADILPGLTAAGDHVAGPYPATLEGAVRAGLAAAQAISAA